MYPYYCVIVRPSSREKPCFIGNLQLSKQNIRHSNVNGRIAASKKTELKVVARS